MSTSSVDCPRQQVPALPDIEEKVRLFTILNRCGGSLHPCLHHWVQNHCGGMRVIVLNRCGGQLRPCLRNLAQDRCG
eukprot:179340-Amphidinium_carterae.1